MVRLWSRVRDLIDRLSGGSLNRVHILEVVMTVGIIGMSFLLVALMLARFTEEPEKAKRRRALTEVSSAGKPPDSMTIGEVRLGEFTFMFMPRTPSASGMNSDRLHVLQFNASALIGNRDETSRVEDVFETYQNRVRATVDAVTRGATDDELHDPKLDSVRRRIRTRVNSLIGEDVIDEVVFSEFRYYRL